MNGKFEGGWDLFGLIGGARLEDWQRDMWFPL